MDIFHAILLGVIEGVTEFLPVSSTGHLILAGELLRIPQSEVTKSFNIAIQLGAICAVLVLYTRSFLNIDMLKKLFVGFLPTGILGFLLYPFIKGFLLASPLIVVWALFLGGIALIAFEYVHAAPIEDAPPSSMTYLQSFAVGLCQSLAMVPGVSRSAATILGGLLMGIPRTTIVEFSFLLAVPTMLAATSYDIFKTAHLFSLADGYVLATGFAVSFIVALLSMRMLVRFVRTHSFVGFGVYRVVIAILFFFVIL